MKQDNSIKQIWHSLSPRGVLSFVVMLLFCTSLTRCASIGSPNGGPKDTLPPKILSLQPQDYTINFQGKDKKIYIDFNEYVQIKDQQKELYTSPAMKKKPTLTMRGRSLVVEIKDDSLLENTTYAIEFGSSIADNNEGNPLHGLRYVFSTGSEIDSMVMSGYTENSDKADSLGRTFIYFFEADSVEQPDKWDSTLFKYKPSKIARSQKNGIFIAQNLKPVDYFVYGVYDSNDNQAYEPSVDKVGFLEGRYNPTKMPDFAIWYDSLRQYPSADPQLYLRMFTDVSFRRQNLQEAIRPDQHRLELRFGASCPNIEKITLEGIPQEKIIIEPLTEGRDTLALWLNVESETLPDTIKGEVTFFRHDSLRQLQRHTEPVKMAWRRVESREQQREREKLEREKKKAEDEGREWQEPLRPSTFRFDGLNTTAEVNPEEDLPFNMVTPPSKFDSTSFMLLSWGEAKDTLREPFHFIADSISPRKWRLKAKWDVKREYLLDIPTDAVADITGEGNDSMKIKITVKDIEKFATLKLNIKPRVEGAEYIVDLVDASNKVLRSIPHLGAGEHTINYVQAGDMRMRITEDLNANGKWDSGNLVERRQSERSEFYKNEQDEELFTTKTGWEFEFNLDMNKLFAPVTMRELIERLDKREMARLKKLEEERLKDARNGRNNHNHNHGNTSGGNSMRGFGGGMGGGLGNLGSAGGMF